MKILVDPEPKDRAKAFFSERVMCTTLQGALKVFLLQELGMFQVFFNRNINHVTVEKTRSNAPDFDRGGSGLDAAGGC